MLRSVAIATSAAILHGSVLVAATAMGAGAFAQGIAAPEITNAAIRAILASRSARLESIHRHLSRGAFGENNKALLQARDLSALPLQERAAVQKLLREENADRESMFIEIAAATGTDLSQLPRIRERYAAALRADARRGDWIQMPDGSWRQHQ